jgi:atypical dual specificity phosphatase
LTLRDTATPARFDSAMLRNFGWVIPGRVAAMGRPGPSDAEALRAEGITAVLCLAEDGPVDDLARAGFRVRHEPIDDFCAPDPATLARCVGFVQESIERGDRVLVHCHAGYGRTGTVLAALLASRGEDPRQAIERVRRLRPGSIETLEQERAVLDFARSIPRA